MRIAPFSVVALLAASLSSAQQPAPVALTIYNQDFAVARTAIDLDLHPGLNEVTATEVTSRLEPDSVILLDPAGKRPIRVVEQNYDAAIVNQEWLLQKYEGKTIDFQVNTPQGIQTVQGKIIRAGFQRPMEYSFDGQQLTGQSAEPLIEVNGKMQFQLPGLPLFPPQSMDCSSSPPSVGKSIPTKPTASPQSSRTSPAASIGKRRITWSFHPPPTSPAMSTPTSWAGLRSTI